MSDDNDGDSNTMEALPDDMKDAERVRIQANDGNEESSDNNDE